MKLALIKTNQQRKYHVKISPIHSTDDLSIKNAEKVQNLAARWRAICNYFINPGNKQPEGRYKIQQQYKEKRHTPIPRKKKVQPNQVNTIVILISTYRSKHKHNAKSRGKKNRECLRQLYKAIIPI